MVTRLLQPILPVFFAVQFAFLYDGWENKFSLKQLQIGLSIFAFGSLFLIAFAATAGSEVAFAGAFAESILGAHDPPPSHLSHLTPRSHPAGTGTGAPRLPPPSRPPPLAAAAAGAEALEGLSVWATAGVNSVSSHALL